MTELITPADGGSGAGPDERLGARASRMLQFRATWAFVIGLSLTSPIWWFYLYWLPSYFNSRFKLDLSHIGLPLIIVYNLSVIGSVGGGWLPRGYEKLGMNLKKSRLAAMLTCALLVLPIGFAGGLTSEWSAVALLSLGGNPAGIGRIWSTSWELLCALRGSHIEVEQAEMRVRISIV